MNCASSQSACLHMMPSRKAFSPTCLHHHWLWRYSYCFHPMHTKGHNALCPCRMCRILITHIPNLRNKTLYVPLSCCGHPMPTDVVGYRDRVAQFGHHVPSSSQTSSACAHSPRHAPSSLTWGLKLLQQGHYFLVDWAERYVLFSSCF